MALGTGSEVAFSTEVRFSAAYDYRDEPDDPRGCAGMMVELILRGPGGALSCQIMTDWMASPLQEPYAPGQRCPRPRRAKPGLDASAYGGFDPLPAGVHSHALTQLQEDWSGPQDCNILGGPCYGQVDYLVSDDVLAALVSEGSAGAWREMRAIYDDWFAEVPP